MMYSRKMNRPCAPFDGMMAPFEKGGGMKGYCGPDDMPEIFRKRTMAQTFRRGKLINFLERLFIRKASLKKQLEQEEYKNIHPIMSGELKALDMIIDEFIQEFELGEIHKSSKGPHVQQNNKEEN